MVENLLRRTTFIVPDARAAAQFYCDVFGWKKWYDNELSVDARFPPAAPDGARAHLVILQVEDPKIGMLGLMQYLDPPFDTAVPTRRTKVRMGEPILVIETRDIDGVYRRALAAGANVVTPPVDWQVPSHDGKGVIHLRSMSMFDPNGIYMEVNVLRG
ncbi:MAG: VOC family protein [Steroidobacteraceae bacterium]|nr:VOC family protein [Steroidobacteraceae bacterium]MDW8258934.1 VOC family protein [Gammaproteobacteria bacterium]